MRPNLPVAPAGRTLPKRQTPGSRLPSTPPPVSPLPSLREWRSQILHTTTARRRHPSTKGDAEYLAAFPQRPLVKQSRTVHSRLGASPPPDLLRRSTAGRLVSRPLAPDAPQPPEER